MPLVQDYATDWLMHKTECLRGNIAGISIDGARGWVIVADNPFCPVEIEVVVDGVVIARTIADVRRPDLAIKGIGGGDCGFDVAFRRRLTADRDHVVQIRRVADGMQLPGSPQVLAGPRATPEIAAAALEGALSGRTAPAAPLAWASFLGSEMAQLVRARVLRQAVKR